MPIPEIGENCNYCGECASHREFHAIVVLPGQMMVLSELCHGCGLCSLVCPVDVITEKQKVVGVVVKRAGTGDNGVYEYCESRKFRFYFGFRMTVRLRRGTRWGCRLWSGCLGGRRGLQEFFAHHP